MSISEPYNSKLKLEHPSLVEYSKTIKVISKQVFLEDRDILKNKAKKIIANLSSGLLSVEDYAEARFILADSGYEKAGIVYPMRMYKKHINNNLSLTSDKKKEVFAKINYISHILKYRKSGNIFDTNIFLEKNITAAEAAGLKIVELLKYGELPIKNYREQRLKLRESGLPIRTQNLACTHYKKRIKSSQLNSEERRKILAEIDCVRYSLMGSRSSKKESIVLGKMYRSKILKKEMTLEDVPNLKKDLLATYNKLDFTIKFKELMLIMLLVYGEDYLSQISKIIDQEKKKKRAISRFDSAIFKIVKKEIDSVDILQCYNDIKHVSKDAAINGIVRCLIGQLKIREIEKVKDSVAILKDIIFLEIKELEKIKLTNIINKNFNFVDLIYVENYFLFLNPIYIKFGLLSSLLSTLELLESEEKKIKLMNFFEKLILELDYKYSIFQDSLENPAFALNKLKSKTLKIADLFDAFSVLLECSKYNFDYLLKLLHVFYRDKTNEISDLEIKKNLLNQFDYIRRLILINKIKSKRSKLNKDLLNVLSNLKNGEIELQDLKKTVKFLLENGLSKNELAYSLYLYRKRRNQGILFNVCVKKEIKKIYNELKSESSFSKEEVQFFKRLRDKTLPESEFIYALELLNNKSTAYKFRRIIREYVNSKIEEFILTGEKSKYQKMILDYKQIIDSKIFVTKTYPDSVDENKFHISENYELGLEKFLEDFGLSASDLFMEVDVDIDSPEIEFEDGFEQINFENIRRICVKKVFSKGLLFLVNSIYDKSLQLKSVFEIKRLLYEQVDTKRANSFLKKFLYKMLIIYDNQYSNKIIDSMIEFNLYNKMDLEKIKYILLVKEHKIKSSEIHKISKIMKYYVEESIVKEILVEALVDQFFKVKNKEELKELSLSCSILKDEILKFTTIKNIKETSADILNSFMQDDCITEKKLQEVLPVIQKVVKPALIILKYLETVIFNIISLPEECLEAECLKIKPAFYEKLEILKNSYGQQKSLKRKAVEKVWHSEELKPLKIRIFSI